MPLFLSYLTVVFSVLALFLTIFIFLRLRVLLTKYEDKPLLETLNKIVKDLSEQDKRLKDHTLKIEKTFRNLDFCVQKISLVKYNPFDETGSMQSFSLVILDKENNGVLVTALHARERTRIYTKEIAGGKCNLQLSHEEKNALVKATKDRV